MEEGRLDETDEVVEGRLQLSLVSPHQYYVRQTITSGPLEETASESLLSGPLDTSDSSRTAQAGILDKYLLSQSSQSIENFLTPSLASVQSGLLETSSLASLPTQDQTEYRAVNRSHSNRSSLVLSEDDMRSVTSLGGSDMENIVLEMGKLDASQGPRTEFETVVANRDAVIKKLSASLNKLMLERKEDGEISRKLEEEVQGLKDQVSLAIRKASANKEYKDKYKVLFDDNEKLKIELSELSAQTSAKIADLQRTVEIKTKEISNFESSKNILLEKLQTIQTELTSRSSTDDNLKLKLDEVQASHLKEIEDLKDNHELELQRLIDKHEEEQVIEFNMLDHELDKLRDEKQDLVDELKNLKSENDILKQETIEDSTIRQVYRDHELMKEKLSQLETLYKEEKSRTVMLEGDLCRERDARESLEIDLANIGSVLDDTQYQVLPLNVRESLERSVRLSIECGNLTDSRRDSTESDLEATPTHKPSNSLESVRADHVKALEDLKAEHEHEMSELRRYFENVCRQMELKYRAETEELIPARNIATPAQWNISGPISLELGSTNVEFEFESMSPRSGFSSDNQQLSFSSVPAQHSREHSGVVSDMETDPVRNTSGSSVRTHLEDEIILLNSKVDELRKQRDEMSKHHATEIEKTKHLMRKEMEAEHLIKFSQVSKQIQTLQKTELDSMKAALHEEHTKVVDQLNSQHILEINQLRKALDDLKESQKSELEEGNKKSEEVRVEEDKREITPDIYTAMREDLDRLEEEKYNLRSMQVLMKDLMKDLAKHYDLSERQAKLLSDSTLFDSLSLSGLNTPAKYLTGEVLRDGGELVQSFIVPELTEDLHQLRLDNSESSRQLVQDLMQRVKDSNSLLSQTQARLESQAVTPKSGAVQMSSSNFVGVEAGKLEVEKARLEAELEVALQRIQELETSGRLSIPRSDVISGLGEAGLESLDIGDEVREKAQRLLTLADNCEREEVVRVLGDLLVYTDSLTTRAREKVAEVEQQLEVADKQLRATRQFLEEQAVEREQEREEWDRRLMEVKQNKVVLVRTGLDEQVEGEVEESESTDHDSKQVQSLKSELAAAVDKIYELRDIIRGLESKVQVKTRQELEQGEVMRELKLSLEEAELSGQLVAGELERLREASTEREVVDHIRALEEQLVTKSAELSKQRAAAGNMMEVKAQLRTMEERLELTTRDLETLTVPASCSINSSRVSTPAPSRVDQLGSFEDIAGALSGLELEELSRLETKLKQLEKAEAAAMERVKKLETDNQDLQSQLDYLKGAEEQLGDLQSAKSDLEDRLTQQSQEMTELQSSKSSQQKRLTEQELELEELQSERSVLQERLTHQQVKISSLESSLQATRHKADKEERLQTLSQEREALRTEVTQLRAEYRQLEVERSRDRERLLQMLQAQPEVPESCESCEKLSRDNSELQEITEKLQEQLGSARAAQLAAQKTEMPLLAQKLLDEKNQELEHLKSQLSNTTSGISIKQSTPNPGQTQSWISKLDDSSGSVENLRDASAFIREKTSDLSLDVNPLRSSSHIKVLPGSAQKLQTIQESETGLCDTFSKTQSETPVRSSQRLQDITHAEAAHITKPTGDLTSEIDEMSPEIEEAFNRKIAEIEYMTQLLNEKDEIIENLQDNLEDIQAQVEDYKKAEESNKDILEKAREDEDKLVEMHNELVEAKNQLEQYENKLHSDADSSLVEELNALKIENQDRIRGMENLHEIIESSQRVIDEKEKLVELLEQKLNNANENIKDLEGKISNSNANIQKYESQLKEKLEIIFGLEKSQSLIKSKLHSLQTENEEIKASVQRESGCSKKVVEEKQMLEMQLEKVTLEMASVQNVVAEMTRTFKHQVQMKDQELKKSQEENVSLSSLSQDLKSKCEELEDINRDNRLKIEQLENRISESGKKMKTDLEAGGSLEDLSNLVQAELDLSSELDNTLLSQVVTGLGLDNSQITNNSTGVSEVQRLLKKIQGDGIDVLSLSERLFLMQHCGTSVSKNLNNTSDSESGSKERELERKLELLEFQLKQEKFLAEDLRQSLLTEKRTGLDNLNKMGQERRSRSELETELALCREKLSQTEYRLSLKESQLHFNSDSENEEFLNTIEAQKVQIVSLEESLRQEKENFSQLQHVLEVERARGKKEVAVRHQSEVLEKRLSLVQQELERERVVRQSVETKAGTEDASRLIIKQLQRDLQYEREKLGQHEILIAREKQKYSDLYTEFEHLRRSGSNSSQSPLYQLKLASDQEIDNYLKDKNFELERFNSELEVRLDSQDREVQRLRSECLRLETELRQEREQNGGGMSQDQLSRMQQVNKFLEHNLKENGEMLSSLAKLYEEGREMKKRNLELEDAVSRCVCSRASLQSSDQRSVQAKHLRAESYRKALIWQKRYLLVLISGDVSPDPVFVVDRDYKLDRLGRFRALVHGVIAVLRMRFLVKRWRTGKRALAYFSPSTPTQFQPALPSLDLTPSQSPTLSRVSKSHSIQRLPSNSPRNPPTFARSHSVRSPFPREPGSAASSRTNSISSSRAQVFTGQTPPTRDTVKVRRSASLTVRRSLDTNLGAVGDQELQRDLEDYFRRYGSLQKYRDRQ